MLYIYFLTSITINHKRYICICNHIAMPRKQVPTTAEQPFSLTIEGYEVVEKVAKQCATSARILVPKHWIGKRVRVVRVDP